MRKPKANAVIRRYRPRAGGRSYTRREYINRKRAERLAAGLCIYCPTPVDSSSTILCKHHVKLAAARRRAKSKYSKCNDCSAPRVAGHAYCQKHYESVRARQVKRERERKMAGVCVDCGRRPHVAGKTLCSDCTIAHRNTVRAIRAKRLAAGLCQRCGQSPYAGKSKLCATCYYKTLAYDNFGTYADWETLRSMFESSGRRCAYSGLVLTLGVDAHLDHRVAIAGIGDAANDQGIKNVQWVHKMVNQMKWSFSEKEFLRMVETIYKHRFPKR